MKHVLVTHKVTKRALQLLRFLAAYTGEKQYAVLERLVYAEFQKIDQEQRTKHNSMQEHTPHD